MDWSNERYVRIYVRDTKTWKLLGWEGQAVLCLLARRFDRSGLLDDVRDAEDVALMIGGGFPVEIAEVGLCKILDKGVMEIVKDGLFWPKFMSAQEASKTNAQRQREFRERRRAGAKLESMSRNVTDAKQNVTKSNAGVTAHNELSQHVTPTSAVLCCADPVPTNKDKNPRKRVTKKQCVLPDDWQPNRKHRDLATQNGVDMLDQAERFRDHFLAKLERKADWDRAFNNWLRNAPGFSSGNGKRPKANQNRHQQNMDFLAEEWRKAKEDELKNSGN